MKGAIADWLDLPALLSQGMGARVHWFTEDVSVARLAATLAGMANAEGGMLLLGITPRSAHVVGVRNADEAIDRVFQAALMIDPPLILPVPRIHEAGGVKALVVSVTAGLPHVYSLDGRYLGREGSQTTPLPARRLRQLLMERGVVHFEAQTPPGACLDDLDIERVRAYLQSLPVEQPEDPWEALERRGCLRFSPEGRLPTYAALLLFGKAPQRWLPGAIILAARFNGVTFSDRFVKQEISGALPDQLRQAEAFLKENMRSVVRIRGMQHEETGEYPFEAARELLVNAAAHRDYNLQGDVIHLNIFADRLEVISPGKLPGPVTLDNLLEARFSRNAALVQALADMGYVERLGYGLDRVTAVMRENGLRPPRFEESAGTFRVTLFGEADAAPGHVSPYYEHDLNARQMLALKTLARQRRITNSQYQELCPDVHAETLRRDLADLTARGLIIKVGDKRATYYILKAAA
ncbi:MAG: putative DNA binding domain-containing protein [Chloroflexi bacterium]|nr:putative DNA binding domain-containing protein [Chloroflexota bacterium]